MNEFELNIKSLYRGGASSFLNKVEIGYDETHYLHALLYYIPTVAKQTWNNHRCGIWVFIMQGYECRNKESKSIMRKFNDNKQQKLAQNLKRLWDLHNNDRRK